MPQVQRVTLNKTVYGAGLNRAASPPDSLSIYLTQVGQRSLLEIYSITWGIVTATNAALDSFDFGPLLVIKNEEFDPQFNYGAPTVPDIKHVVWQDEIVRDAMFNHREFYKPLRLTDATSYLIIVPAPTDLAAAATPYDMALTVRGDVRERKRLSLEVGKKTGGEK